MGVALTPAKFDEKLDQLWSPLKLFLDNYPKAFRLEFTPDEGYILYSDLHYLTPLLGGEDLTAD